MGSLVWHCSSMQCEGLSDNSCLLAAHLGKVQFKLCSGHVCCTEWLRTVQHLDASPTCVLVMPLVTPFASCAVKLSPSYAFPTLFLALPPTPTHRGPHTSVALLRRYPVRPIRVSRHTYISTYVYTYVQLLLIFCMCCSFFTARFREARSFEM